MRGGSRRAAPAWRLAAVVLGLCALFLAAPGATAQEPGDGRFVVVAQVAGWIDPVLVDFVLDAVTRAPEPGLEVLVLQVDSPGALVDDATMDEVVAAIEASPVPVAVWARRR